MLDGIRLRFSPCLKIEAALLLGPETLKSNAQMLFLRPVSQACCCLPWSFCFLSDCLNMFMLDTGWSHKPRDPQNLLSPSGDFDKLCSGPVWMEPVICSFRKKNLSFLISQYLSIPLS